MARPFSRDLKFYLHIPSSFANGMNHTKLCLPSRSWHSFTDPGGWKAELAMGGWWLQTEFVTQHDAYQRYPSSACTLRRKPQQQRRQQQQQQQQQVKLFACCM